MRSHDQRKQSDNNNIEAAFVTESSRPMSTRPDLTLLQKRKLF